MRATLVSVPDGPLIVQSDKTLLLEVDHPDALACRMAIAPFAELERSPEHVHTYRLTPLGLWNARAAGHDAEQVVDALLRFSRYPVPHALLVDVADTMDRYGRLQLLNDPAHGLVLRGLDRAVLEEVAKQQEARRRCSAPASTTTRVVVHPSERGRLKQALLKVGWPAEDLAGYVDGEAHPIDAAPRTAGSLRAYQRRRSTAFWAGGSGRRRAALRCRQDARRRGRDGRGRGDHADPGHQHGRRPAVEARADRPHQR